MSHTFWVYRDFLSLYTHFSMFFLENQKEMGIYGKNPCQYPQICEIVGMQTYFFHIYPKCLYAASHALHRTKRKG